jgi:hypothetical protein
MSDESLGSDVSSGSDEKPRPDEEFHIGQRVKLILDEYLRSDRTTLSELLLYLNNNLPSRDALPQ